MLVQKQERQWKSSRKKFREVSKLLLDLAEYNVQFSDGRNYLEYEGDTGYVTKTIMEADAMIIGTPIFQASIPATLKISLIYPVKHLGIKL